MQACVLVLCRVHLDATIRYKPGEVTDASDYINQY